MSGQALVSTFGGDDDNEQTQPKRDTQRDENMGNKNFTSSWATIYAMARPHPILFLGGRLFASTHRVF